MIWELLSESGKQEIRNAMPIVKSMNVELYIITTLWMKLETEITIAFGIVANAKREESEFMNLRAGRQFLMTGFLHT